MNEIGSQAHLEVRGAIFFLTIYSLGNCDPAKTTVTPSKNVIPHDPTTSQKASALKESTVLPAIPHRTDCPASEPLVNTLKLAKAQH